MAQENRRNSEGGGQQSEHGGGEQSEHGGRRRSGGARRAEENSRSTESEIGSEGLTVKIGLQGGGRWLHALQVLGSRTV
jgi:hypothetical protein